MRGIRIKSSKWSSVVDNEITNRSQLHYYVMTCRYTSLLFGLTLVILTANDIENI